MHTPRNARAAFNRSVQVTLAKIARGGPHGVVRISPSLRHEPRQHLRRRDLADLDQHGTGLASDRRETTTLTVVADQYAP
jgi:hypothetical protein